MNELVNRFKKTYYDIIVLIEKRIIFYQRKLDETLNMMERDKKILGVKFNESWWEENITNPYKIELRDLIFIHDKLQDSLFFDYFVNFGINIYRVIKHKESTYCSILAICNILLKYIFDGFTSIKYKKDDKKYCKNMEMLELNILEQIDWRIDKFQPT